MDKDKKSAGKISKEDENKELLSKALSGYFTDRRDQDEIKYKQMTKALCSCIEEYLSTYIILGYTVDGDPVNVTFAQNQKDLDSLSTTLHRYMITSSIRGQFPSGNNEE